MKTQISVFLSFSSNKMILLKKIFALALCLVFFQSAEAGWTNQNSNTLAWLHDIYFLNEQKGWIAGSNGTFLETADGGATWRQASKFTSDAIKQIQFFDEKNGWLLCERDVYNRGALSTSYVLQTTDGGKNWSKLEFAKSGRERITKIVFGKNGAALAFGEGGMLFFLENDKKSWKKTPFFIKYLLLDGTFTDDSSSVIVGAGGSALFSDDAGASWNIANIYGDKSARLNSIFFINAKNGWAAGANGKLFQTSSGGKNWREQISPISENLTDIFFTNTAEGWAVGDNGAILHTTTAGNIWNEVPANTKHRLEKVLFNGKQGWIIGFGGTILRYDANSKSR